MKIQFKSEELIIFESSLYRTTTSLIIGEQYILLVDPNWLPIELDFIEETIQEVGKDKETYLLFTHSDYDHIIGYGQFKNYKTIASSNFVNNKNQASILQQIEKFDDEYYVSRSYDIEYPKIDMSFAGNNEKLQIGADSYCFYQAQGHNIDGLLTFNESKGILIVGDYLSNIEFPYIYDSLVRYKATLASLEQIINQYTIRILISGHGDFTTDKSEMLQRIQDSRKYIADLEGSILNQKEFDTTQLYTRYKFPIIMDAFHQGNIKLAKAELRVK
ncbi:MAG: MBL fold metallo-hydrolase [Aureispira sp.]|nr:MBL fold metallo-hydrolase [Aureispira sp.]